MFSIRALDNLNSRGKSLGAYRMYVKESLDEARENIRQRASLCISLIRFSALCTVVVLVAFAVIYLPRDLAVFATAGGCTVAATGLLNLLLIFNVGLLRDEGNVSTRVLGTANKLTIVRFILIVPVVALILDDKLVLALGAYIACAGTDVLDGIVARRKGETTEFGTIMDPLADIFSTAGVYGALLANGLVPAWVFVILMIRYATLFLGSAILFFVIGPIKFRATPVGKVVGVLQAAAAILIITLTALGADWQAALGSALFPFLGIIFASVIVSQLIIGARHIRKGTIYGSSPR